VVAFKEPFGGQTAVAHRPASNDMVCPGGQERQGVSDPHLLLRSLKGLITG